MTLKELDEWIQKLKTTVQGDAGILIPSRNAAAEHLTQIDQVTVSIKGKDVPGILLG